MRRATEENPVSDDEYVYRRVLRTWYYGSELSARDRVDRQAFQPTKKDINGLSVYRASFVQPEALDRDSAGDPGRYYVARLAVATIRELDLTVVPDPMQGLPSHALVPEIRDGLKGERKNWSKEMQLKLARLAGTDIVYSPPASSP